jgi:hypothetical protein
MAQKTTPKVLLFLDKPILFVKIPIFAVYILEISPKNEKVLRANCVCLALKFVSVCRVSLRANGDKRRFTQNIRCAQQRFQVVFALTAAATRLGMLQFAEWFVGLCGYLTITQFVFLAIAFGDTTVFVHRFSGVFAIYALYQWYF